MSGNADRPTEAKSEAPVTLAPADAETVSLYKVSRKASPGSLRWKWYSKRNAAVSAAQQIKASGEGYSVWVEKYAVVAGNRDAMCALLNRDRFYTEKELIWGKPK